MPGTGQTADPGACLDISTWRQSCFRKTPPDEILLVLTLNT
jgi:hypothetical protein